jgi:Kae1-associated kinase Bud32
MKLIQQGAEAKIFLNENVIVKERVKKDYRCEEIDKVIRKTNTRKEAKLLEKAWTQVPTPKVLNVCDKDMKITMEHIKGDKLRDVVDKVDRKKIFTQIGKDIAKLHNMNIIHGDLTTSNIIVNDKIYFIDFGLGFTSTRIEDKAVDIHLIKKALESKHYLYSDECIKYILEGYKNEVKEFDSIMKRLEKVEGRGHYKQAFSK